MSAYFWMTSAQVFVAGAFVAWDYKFGLVFLAIFSIVMAAWRLWREPR